MPWLASGHWCRQKVIEITLSPTPEVTVFLNRTGRFGNKLSVYYTALALCILAGIPCTLPEWQYEDLVITPYPKELISDASSSPQNTPQLLHYCTTCPFSAFGKHFHECPGLWMAPDIRTHLQSLDTQRHGKRRGIVIQYRCGEGTFKNGMMGLLPFDYYSFIVQREKTAAEFGVAILPDPSAVAKPCCIALMHSLAVGLSFKYGVEVEQLKPRSVRYDMGLIINARVFIASASTFGLFLAIASHGKAYLPVAKLFMNAEVPCFPHVHWVSTDRILTGCWSHVLHWFVRNDPDVRKHLAAVLGGPWFGRGRRGPRNGTRSPHNHTRVRNATNST